MKNMVMKKDMKKNMCHTVKTTELICWVTSLVIGNSVLKNAMNCELLLFSQNKEQQFWSEYSLHFKIKSENYSTQFENHRILKW